MSGKFGMPDMSGITNMLSSLERNQPSLSEYRPIIPDKRSRTEIREDFEKELQALDKDAIEKLKDDICAMEQYSEEYSNSKNDVENALVKFLRFYDKFEDLNSEESRKVALKEQELKLEAKHDWAEKFRLFFFRVLASVLFIVTLFTIGYIEKEYDWATLPMSKYISTMPSPVSK
ncbi:hypothetical protein K6672_004301 [Vibrio vulnificus]|uniref:Uncharacterized protein n=1 Tax=Vibrio vulnificus TaxID=672 RepID=A0ABX4WXS7_VIBVL|nr:hypothetical protein [Vibrio vulnificus]EGQ9279566.1 hypothetical protein [Vibrio vulnificus]EGQ9939656.1 hypothetical protein [Vibrio vulnificus]EGR0054778.1 hypothetical protein [Vibrio vulnificus]EGR0102224.1 hypothetical protein [Vibrio vulnificus]EHH1227674.1 hypothetical protein [Vibrio vulnificus]